MNWNHQPAWDATYYPPSDTSMAHNVHDGHNFMYQHPEYPTPPLSYGSTHSDPSSPMDAFGANQPRDDTNWTNPEYQFAPEPYPNNNMARWNSAPFENSNNFSWNEQSANAGAANTGGAISVGASSVGAHIENVNATLQSPPKKPRTIAEAHFQNLNTRATSGAVLKNTTGNPVLNGNTLDPSITPGDFNNDHHPPTLHPELPPSETQQTDTYIMSNGRQRKRPAPVIPKTPRHRPSRQELERYPPKAPHVCKWEDCGKMFKFDVDFYDHLDEHLKIEDGLGKMCRWTPCARDEAFKYTYQLTNHLRIHTGEKPFVCEEEGCGKSFARSDGLRAHYLFHSGERPFACPLCDCNFSFASDLNRHLRLKHEVIDPYAMHPAPSSSQTPLPQPTFHSPAPSNGTQVHPSWHQGNFSNQFDGAYKF